MVSLQEASLHMRCTRLAKVLVAGLLLSALGCGRGAPEPNPVEVEANSKVDAMNRLADAMAKDPNGADARGALEELRITGFDFKNDRKQAEEVVAIYRQRIQGKYQGEVATEVRAFVAGIESGLKQNAGK
jgi:hypothetical protein